MAADEAARATEGTAKPVSQPSTNGDRTVPAQIAGTAGIDRDEFGLPIKTYRKYATESDDEENWEDANDGAVEGKKPTLEGESELKEPAKEASTSVPEPSPMKEVETVKSPTMAPKEKRLSTKQPIPVEPEQQEQLPPADLKKENKRSSKIEAATASKPPEDHRPEAEKVLFPKDQDVHDAAHAGEFSHQLMASQKPAEEKTEEDEWQTMPAFAPFDIYNDDGKLVAKEEIESESDEDDGIGGAGKGYTRVNIDEDAQSATSMDDNTQYLFKETDNEDEARDILGQMQATKDLLTEGQRIAYVGICRLAMVSMSNDFASLERTRSTKKMLLVGAEGMKQWAQKLMLRLYTHMEISPAEQVMIEQLSDHGVEPGDLTGILMLNSRVKNPKAEAEAAVSENEKDEKISEKEKDSKEASSDSDSLAPETIDGFDSNPPPPYSEGGEPLPGVTDVTDLPDTKTIDIDLRWTVLCDLFLVLLADSVYDSRSRRLLEIVGEHMSVPWLDICKFEKRVTDALEMQEEASRENWDEHDHMESRRKHAIKKRMVMMGLATVGGGLVIGLSAGLLAPVIGAGLAAGFTTIGVAGTSSFLAGAGGAAIITTGATLSGGAIGVRASHRRTKAVTTFEYKPLYNNKRVNLIVTVSGWMTGKLDDVRLPFSTVDPVLGDIYSVLWEPEVLQSVGQTMSILATEALTQSLQQILGSTILVGLMAAIQLPVILSKLAYLIDNPWTVSVERATAAGLILADSLVDRNLGVRPVTLVGYSLGARVIFSCLRELANVGAFGLVQNVYIFGAPVVGNKDDWLKARSVVSGRIVNGYSTNDWILGYLFRATGGGLRSVAGLAPVEAVPRIENFNITEFVDGHLAYREAVPRLMKHVGWPITSEEFTEIEDPDPDKFRERQRELLDEIAEARKKAEEEPKKRRFGFFGRKTEVPKKEAWETYDDVKREPAPAAASPSTPEPGDPKAVLFDVDAIKAQVANLDGEDIPIRQLETTLPPMKLNFSPSPVEPASLQHSKLRGISSNDSPSRPRLDQSPAWHAGGALSDGRSVSLSTAELATRNRLSQQKTLPSIPDPIPERSASVSGLKSPMVGEGHFGSPVLPTDRNVWLDEDEDFGKEKEITMTFE